MPPARPVSNNSAVRKFGQALSLAAALGGSAPSARPQRTLDSTEQASAANELGNSQAMARGNSFNNASTPEENYQPPAGTDFEAPQANKSSGRESLTKRLFGVSSAKANYTKPTLSSFKNKASSQSTPESNTYDELMAEQSKSTTFEKLMEEQNRNRAALKAEKETEKTDDTLRNKITSGNLLHIIKRVLPKFETMLDAIEKAPAEKRLPLLKNLRALLHTAEAGAGFLDGCTTWAEVFSLSLPTIVVPFLLPLVFLPWVILYMSFGRILGGTLSVGIHKIVQIVDQMTAETEKQVIKNQKKKSMLARLMNMRRQPAQ